MENNSTDTPISNIRHHVAVVASSSQGAREYQEDACGNWFDTAGKQLFAVVADGAGGHGGGADAARAAVTSAAQAWEKCPVSDLAEPDAFLAKWMADAHRAVNEESALIRRSARAVVVACLTDGHMVHWVHAGDCRLLRFHEGKLMERTRDDSVVQVLFERGDITEDEMGTHPDQSRLLQSLGGEDVPSPRPGSADVAAGDVLILCSDGFWEHLKREELEELAAVPAARRQRALDQAVAKAVRRGGVKADNTTAILIAFDDGKKRSRSGIRWALLLVLLAALAGGVFALSWDQGSSDWKEYWQKFRKAIGLLGTQSTQLVPVPPVTTGSAPTVPLTAPYGNVVSSPKKDLVTQQIPETP
jgi:serine/threonine protein phosphatase PrpC